MAQEFDTIIRDGTIVDGTGVPAYLGDIGINGGRIARIGGLSGARGRAELDASGLIVAPGFVDLHTHYDAQIYWDPYCTGSGWHGVTTVIIGNCGFGFAPCRPSDQERDRLMLAMTRNEQIPFQAMKQGMPWDWVTYSDFLDSIGRTPKGVNVASLVPLAPIYAWVMGGYDAAKQRRPTEAEAAEMCRLVDEGMAAGADGWSAQVLGPLSVQPDWDASPTVTDLMTETELMTFAQSLRKWGRGAIQLAYKAFGSNDSLEFCGKVAEAANRPVIYQQILPRADAQHHRELLRVLEECGKRRVPLFGQADTRRGGFEITFAYFNFWDMLPLWVPVTLGATEERLARLADPALRATLKAEYDAGRGPSFADWLIRKTHAPALQDCDGRTVGEVAEQQGKHLVDALFDLLVADDLRTELWMEQARNRDHCLEIMRSPRVLGGVGDGGAHIKMFCNGNYGTDYLVWLVRDEGAVTLEQAHYKLSYLPAFVMGLTDRGCLREGAVADIIVYDLDKLAVGDVGVAHDLPGGDWRRVQRPTGYRWTMVNGQVTFEDGKSTGALPGKLLRYARG